MVKELYAEFVRQQWMDDQAQELGRDYVRMDRVLLTQLDAIDLKNVHDAVVGNLELDDLAYEADLIGDGPGQHDGPFAVFINERELKEFFASVGIDDIEELTDEQLGEVRERYLAEIPDEDVVPTM